MLAIVEFCTTVGALTHARANYFGNVLNSLRRTKDPKCTHLAAQSKLMDTIRREGTATNWRFLAPDGGYILTCATWPEAVRRPNFSVEWNWHANVDVEWFPLCSILVFESCFCWFWSSNSILQICSIGNVWYDTNKKLKIYNFQKLYETLMFLIAFSYEPA